MKPETKRLWLILLCLVAFFLSSFLCAVGFASKLGPIWINYIFTDAGLLLFPTSIYFLIKVKYKKFS